MMPAIITSRVRVLCVLLAVAASGSACSRPVPPPVVVSAPKFPEFTFPGLTPPVDAKQADLLKLHDAGWRWLQAGDLPQAERDFQAVLKRSPAFYPSETALGYLELARNNYPGAIDHFDRVLHTTPSYVPALLGRGQTLLAQSNEPEALTAFEAALTSDPTLSDVARRVEVLRARQAQQIVATARAAAQAGRLDEAARAYEQAIAASPESAFLFRDIAEVEAKQGKPDQALGHYRKAVQLDPSDVQSRIHIGEMLEASHDIEGAMAAYNEVNSLEPSTEIQRRLNALEARAAYLRLPAEYRAIPEAQAITRGDLAALIGIRLQGLLTLVPAQPVVITDTRNDWAASWITATVAAGVMDVFENHTFGPRNTIHRSDLAQAVSRMLKIIASRETRLLKDWQSRQQKMSDVGVSNLNYADASLSVAAGILELSDTGAFQLSRPISGAEAIDAIDRLERLLNSAR
jgi:tetratricopeptide (TPR) repeat protein